MSKQWWLLFLLLTACSDKSIIKDDMPLNDLYAQAITQYKAKNYKTAIQYFSAVERQYPYSDWAIRAQLMEAYCQFLVRAYDDAIENFTLFQKFHPHHPQIPYVLYMLGLSYFEQLSIIERDQSFSKDALKYFEELSNRFPSTKYAQDAKERMIILKDHLAAKEVYSGLYEQTRGVYASAINRYKFVTQHYPETRHVPEAYYRMVESYTAMGLKDEASHAAQTLIKQHPASSWTHLAKHFATTHVETPKVKQIP